MQTRRNPFFHLVALLSLLSLRTIASAFAPGGAPSPMGRTSGRRNQRRARRPQSAQPPPSTIGAVNDDDDEEPADANFILAAGPGCHMARRRPLRTSDAEQSHRKDAAENTQSDDWVLGWEDVDPEDYDADQVPDVAVDPDRGYTLTLCNLRHRHVVAYITVFDLQLRDRNNRCLEQGSTTDQHGGTRNCTTLIVLCPPHTFAHLCRVDESHHISLEELEDWPLESDVSPYVPHPNPNDTHAQAIGFPLGGPASVPRMPQDAASDSMLRNDAPTAYLCTQGEQGILTHFLTGNLHAIDFDCPVGTPLLAVGNGVVVGVQQDNNGVTGIGVTNLYRWNSIMIQLDARDDQGNEDPLFVEYVHIESACVAKGDHVKLGQVIGTSGSVGFSPRPHLHLAAYRSSKLTAPTVRVLLRASDGSVYLPTAGYYYNVDGPVPMPPAAVGDRLATLDPLVQRDTTSPRSPASGTSLGSCDA